MSYRERLHLLMAEGEKEWTIPPEKPWDKIAKYLTREGKLLELIAEVLIDIDEVVKTFRMPAGQITIDVGPIVMALNRLTEELRSRITELGEVITRPKPVKMIASYRRYVTDSLDDIMTIDEGTDMVMLQNVGDNTVRYSFNTSTSDGSLQLDPKAIIMINIPSDYRKLFMRGIGGTSEVIVSEWRYVEH